MWRLPENRDPVGDDRIVHKSLEVINEMEKLLTRKEAAGLLGISIATLDAARTNGQIAFVQYVENGCVYFTEESLQEYIARATHRAKPREVNTGNRYSRIQIRR